MELMLWVFFTLGFVTGISMLGIIKLARQIIF